MIQTMQTMAVMGVPLLAAFHWIQMMQAVEVVPIGQTVAVMSDPLPVAC